MPNFTSDRTAFRLVSSWHLLLIVALVGLVGCQRLGCGQQTAGPSGEIPDSADQRLDQLSGQIPATTEVSAIIDDTAAVRDTIEQARANSGGNLPVLNEMEKNFSNQTGIQMFDEQSWTDAGLAADGGAALTSMTGRPVMLVYVDDRDAFEKHFTKQAKSSLDVSGSAKSETVGGASIKVIGDKDNQRIAWGYTGKLAAITIPPNEDARENDTPTATDALDTILNLTAKNSLRQTTGFEKFRKAIAEKHNFMIYADSDAAIDEGLLSGAAKRFASASGSETDQLKRQFDGVGLVFSLDNNRVGGRMWVGMNEKTAADIQSMYTQGPEVDWSNLGTEHTLLAGRLSTKWSAFWKNYLEGLSDSARRDLENQIKRVGQAVGIDANKDFIDNLSGQMALFIYGVTPTFNAAQFSQNPLGAIDQIGAILALQVDSHGKLRNTVQTIADQAGGFVNLETVGDAEVGSAEAVHVVSFRKPDETSGMAAMLLKNPPPIRIYAYKHQLAIATNAIDPQPMANYLKGERDEAPLTDADRLDMGGSFVSDNQMTGLYINFVRIQNHLMTKLPPIRQVQQSLKALEEVMINFEPKDQGAFINVSVDLDTSFMGGNGGDSEESGQEESTKTQTDNSGSDGDNDNAESNE